MSGPSNDLVLFAEVLRLAIEPGFLLAEDGVTVLRRESSSGPGHRYAAPTVERHAAMVRQMIASRHLTVGGTHHVVCNRVPRDARSVLVPRSTHQLLSRWSALRPVA